MFKEYPCRISSNSSDEHLRSSDDRREKVASRKTRLNFYVKTKPAELVRH